MEEKKRGSQSGYSVEEILAEAHVLENRGKAEKRDSPGEESPRPNRRKGSIRPEEILRRARQALNMESGESTPGTGGGKGKMPRKNRKKHFPIFHKEKENPSRMEDDIYYGLQLKPLDEYRREYEKTVREEISGSSSPEKKETEKKGSGSQHGFPYLFDEDQEKEKEEGPEFSETVKEIHRERQERLEKIMKHAGIDAGDIFGPGQTGPEIPSPADMPPQPGVRKPARVPEVPQKPGPFREPETPPPGPMRPAVPSVPKVPELKKEEDASAGNTERPSQNRAGREEAPPAPVREPAPPPDAREREPTPPPRGEPKERPLPKYRAEKLPVHVINPGGIEDALTQEASCYKIPQPAEPEPIPFPSRPESAEKGKAASREAEAAPPGPEAKEEPSAPAAEEKAAPPISFPGTEKKEKPKKRFRLFGSEEDAGEPDKIPSGPEKALEDYCRPEDAASVREDLSAKVRVLVLRFAVTGICTAVLLALGFFTEYPALFPPGLHSFSEPQVPLIMELIFLLIDAGFCGPAIWNGLCGLFSFQANSDSAAAVASAAALLQNLFFMFSSQPDGLHLYVPLASAALFLNTAGKLSMSRRLLHNFQFVSMQGEKYAVRIFDDRGKATGMVPENADGDPKIAWQSKTSFLSDFLRLSYRPDPSDHISQLLAPAGFIADLVLCVLTAVLTKDGVTALTAFTAAACVCVPFSNTLCVNMPLAKLSKIAERCGGMAVGWPAVEKFSETGWVLLDAQDLFPRGTVTLNGIQTFAGSRIDQAILDATALTKSAGGLLRDLFSQIVKSREDILPRVTNVAYEDGAGVSGRVSGRVVLVGNRELLIRHGVNAPSRDYEEKYRRAGKIPLYLACGGSLVAMFLVSYRSDRRRAKELRRLEYNGIGIVVRTRDPDITPHMLSGCFGISERSILVLPEHIGERYQKLRTSPPERTKAVLATKGRAAAMMRLLTACVRQHGNISIAVALLAAGAVLGFALVAFFTLSSGLGQLSSTALFLFEAFWAFTVLFIPRIRKP